MKTLLCILAIFFSFGAYSQEKPKKPVKARTETRASKAKKAVKPTRSKAGKHDPNEKGSGMSNAPQTSPSKLDAPQGNSSSLFSRPTVNAPR